MKEEIKDQWIKALRSGEYQQTTQYLNRKNGFCCLGVLTDLYIKETGLGEWKPWEDCKIEEEILTFKVGDYEEARVLPNPVLEWAGFKECNTNGAYVGQDTLSLKNDYNHTFEQVADIIAENWEKL